LAKKIQKCAVQRKRKAPKKVEKYKRRPMEIRSLGRPPKSSFRFFDAPKPQNVPPKGKKSAAKAASPLPGGVICSKRSPPQF
jgi:hypothetical protein